MVHLFKHNYKGTSYNFLWDVESGSLSLPDDDAFLCAKNKYSQLTEPEKEVFSKLSTSLICEINSELSQLEVEGCLNANAKQTNFRKDAKFVKALCLHICHDCNLKCDYCFASGGTYNTERDYMSAEIGKKAVDFLIQNSGYRKNLEIDFFGGEPLMSLDTVKQIVDYAKAEAKLNGKIFSFTMTTNCLLLNDENISYLNEEMENVVLSIDGRKCTHNEVRHSLSDKDCFDVILNNALKFKEKRGDKKYYVRGTFTSKNIDFSKDVFFLNDCGFNQISVEPVVLPNEHQLAIRQEHIDRICDEYDKLANGYLERRSGGKWFNFFHFMIDLQNGPCITKRLTGCGAGTEYLAVSPIGELFPCHQFVSIPEFQIGDVLNGIVYQDIREKFADNTLLKKTECNKCFAKYYCGGGCCANARSFSGSIDGTYDIGCTLTKKRLEKALAINTIEKINEE